LEVSKEKKFGPVQQPLGVVSGRVGETWQETMATTRKKKTARLANTMGGKRGDLLPVT